MPFPCVRRCIHSGSAHFPRAGPRSSVYTRCSRRLETVDSRKSRTTNSSETVRTSQESCMQSRMKRTEKIRRISPLVWVGRLRLLQSRGSHIQRDVLLTRTNTVGLSQFVLSVLCPKLEPHRTLELFVKNSVRDAAPLCYHPRPQ